MLLLEKVDFPQNRNKTSSINSFLNGSKKDLIKHIQKHSKHWSINRKIKLSVSKQKLHQQLFMTLQKRDFIIE